MKHFLIKARIKSQPAGPDRIRNYLFADSKVEALNEFRDIYNQPENLDWEEISFQSIEEIAI